MARRIRINEAGFHHVYNRGVERRDIFLADEDKEKFLDITCEISSLYDFIIHGYVLMDNHYHLLVENKKENLSDGMRRINSSYAQYFNKKYKRVGHLWQDRFKSWYILSEEYLLTLFRYIEANPIKARVSKNFGEYRYTLLNNILNNGLRACMRESFVFNFYNDTSELFDIFNMDISKADGEIVNKMQKESNLYKKTPSRIKEQCKIEEYFKEKMVKKERDKKIIEAYVDGFSQSEIARALHLSVSSVSKIVKNSKFEA